ncbi:hypothetical protein [Xanthobacter sediminis]
MRRFLYSLAAVAATAGPALADDTQAAWQGFLTITSSSSGCKGMGGTAVGDVHVSIYRPHIASSNVPAGTTLAIIGIRWAQAFINANEAKTPFMNGSGSASVNAINARGKPFSYTATYASIVTTPKTIATNTATVAIKGTLKNFWNTSSCSVGFTASYIKRTD